MISYLLFIPILVSFFLTFILMPFWIRKAASIGLVWEDMNKFAKKKIAGSGGMIAVLGFIIGSFLYVAYRVFLLHTSLHLIEVFAVILVVLLSAGIGFLDDLIGWRRGGLTRTTRMVLVGLVAAVPLMVINAGKHVVALPFLGEVNAGLFYSLLFIPIGVVGATTTFNFLAGFNGLEAGQGILLLSATAAISYYMGNFWISMVALCMIAALFSFLYFNFYPARVFPGDSLTYAIGALYVSLCILGNFEKIGVFFFIPYILEVFLKARGKLIKQSFGKPMPDGTLDLLYPKVYGLEHIAINWMKSIGLKPTEKKVVALLWSFQTAIIIIGFIIFRNGIFNS